MSKRCFRILPFEMFCCPVSDNEDFSVARSSGRILQAQMLLTSWLPHFLLCLLPYHTQEHQSRNDTNHEGLCPLTSGTNYENGIQTCILWRLWIDPDRVNEEPLFPNEPHLGQMAKLACIIDINTSSTLFQLVCVVMQVLINYILETWRRDLVWFKVS